MKYITVKRCFIGMLIVCIAANAHAQDTVRISLPEAEQQFLRSNLQLLAERYNIDIAKAAIIQAKLYDNPTLTVTGNLYDPQHKKAFNVSNSNGQYDVAVQQLIRLAGKRNKEIKLAELNSNLNESSFFDLLRTLRFSLRSNFYTLYFLQRSASNYQTQANTLEKLATAYDQLQKKDVVTLKDAVRIRALFYAVKTELSELQNKINDVQASLQLLLQNNAAYFIADEKNDLFSATELPGINPLLDSAYNNRADLQLAQRTILYSQQNFVLQKALAKPDITIGGEFDKRGSFVDNASFFSVSMDLPFFKRNQGNIRAAKFSIEQSKVAAQYQQQTVENEVRRSYANLLNADQMLTSIDPAFAGQYEKLLQGITENFQKKNITLIELTDFYESYKDNVLQYNELCDRKMQAVEALNFAVGKTIINK